MFQQNHYQQQPEQEHQVFDHSSAGSMNGLNHSNCNINAHQEQLAVNELPKKRSDVNKEIFDELYELTLTPRQQGREPPRTGRRQNRNEVLAVLIARLIKHKHLNGNNYLYQMNLFRDIQMNSNNGEFVLVLRTDGRIVVMSDEVEQHLGKPMRSLYTQCRNILECLDQADRNKLRLVLNTPADSPRQEHRLVCTFRLPKGRRPSRVREDIKTITMTGHFYSCHDSSSTTDRLFIARCEALISTPTNKSNSLQTNTMINNHTNSTLDITLNEDMSIISVSPNTKNILGYANKEMDGIWIGRYLVTSDLAKLVTIWQKHFQQQLPTSICEIFDMYTSNGEGRLTFLCQIRPVRQRRSKSIKFEITGQLIDPSLRNEYAKYVHSATETNSKLIKAKQVNLVPPSVSKTSEDSVVADSPSFINMAQLIFDNTTSSDCAHQHQPSPFNRSLSNVVAPVNIHDESWQQLFDPDYNQYSFASATTDFHYWPTESFDDDFIKYRSDEELNHIFDEYLNEDC